MNIITKSGLIAAGWIALSLAVAWALTAGWLDADSTIRITMVANALLLAYYGNAIPKAVLRTPIARSGRRFAGWVFVLGGLISAALWAFAPLDIATPIALAVTAGSAILAIGYCRLSRAKTA